MMNDSEIKIAKYLDQKGFRHSLLGFKYAVLIISHCLDTPCDTGVKKNKYIVRVQR